MFGIKIDKIISTILIISLVIAVTAMIYIIIVPQQSEKFAEFYILGQNGKAGNYPTNLTVHESGTVTIGIINHEYTNTTYQLMVKLNQNTLKDENITLTNNEKKEIPLTFKPKTGKNQKLEFLLYKLPDTKNAYRSLYLYVNVS